MVKKARYISWQPLESELQALLTEAELINIHQPPFNVLLKDDKSPIYILITKEDWPRVLRVRKKDLQKKIYQGDRFGPFQSGYKVNEVLKIARRIFPWCNAPRPKDMTKIKRCFYRHLDLCPGVCTHDISQEDYLAIIKELKLFLRGQKNSVLRNLKNLMKESAQEQKFELAAFYRDRIKMVEEITQASVRLKQDFFLPTLYQAEQNREGLLYLSKILHDYLAIPQDYPLTRIEGYDVSNTSGQNAVVSMVVSINGQPDPSEYKYFNIRNLNTPDDFAMMAQALNRRTNHLEWGRPDLILIDGGKGQVRAVLKEVRTKLEWQSIPIIGLAKDPDRLVVPTKIEGNHIDWQIIKLKTDDPALHILQKLRDEAHRFGKKQHTRRRSQDLFD